MKRKLLLAGLVVAAAAVIGYFVYKQSVTATVVNPNPVAPLNDNVDNNLENFYNNILNNTPATTSAQTSPTTTTSNPAQTGTVSQVPIACDAPTLMEVKDSGGMIIASWDNQTTKGLNSVIVQYSKNNKDWTSVTNQVISPGPIGSLNNMANGVTLKANNYLLYVRLMGNCTNGKTTPVSNTLTYNLAYKMGTSI